MAQATAGSAAQFKTAAVQELPDPLHPPQMSAASTDDLLAQLAGEEIDRLLAEADSERPPASAPEPVPATTTDAASEKPPAAPAPQAAISAQLDTLFAQLTEDNASAPQAAAPQAEATTSQTVSPADSISLTENTTALQRAALTGPIDSEATGARRLPLYFRPLVWLSAPLDAFPESVRDIIGKIAILTTVNALFILAYLVLFRHH